MEFSLRDIPNDYSYKKDYLDKNSDKLEILLLGNSHIYFGVNPIYLKQRSFNASHISQSLDYDLEILKKYDTKWTNLKYIVVPIDYFSFYSKLETGIENWRVKNYNIYYGIKGNSNFWDNFEVPNSKFKDNLYRILNDKSDITCNLLGWGTTYNSKKNKSLIETGAIAKKRHTIKKDDLIFNQNIETVKSIINFANKNNIKLIFITSPAYKTYTDNLNRNQLETSVRKVNDLISGKKNSKYYNLINDKSFKFEDFYDADHLNEIGAKKLTTKIDSLVRLN